MGCVSSTEVITDPVTGEVKTKKKLGGAYPGQRGQQHAPYQPPASAFQNGKATAHFVTYGGGNALTLMQPDGSLKPQHGGKESQFVQVTLPDGVESGMKIKVRAPDGRLNEIIIPSGFGPGSTFTVEFAPESARPPPQNKFDEQQAAEYNNTRPSASAPYNPYATGTASATPYAGESNVPTASATPYNPYSDDSKANYATATATPALAPPPAAPHADDGFASGFNNPGWDPSSQNTAGPYASAKPY